MAEIIGFPKGGRQTARPIYEDSKKSFEERMAAWERMSAAADEERARDRQRNGPNMHTFVFRSRKLIVEANEAELVRDVRLDPDKAQKKLTAIRRRLQGVIEQAAAEMQLLKTAETKLAAAITAALLSMREG
jgi:hypothetical protein